MTAIDFVRVLACLDSRLASPAACLRSACSLFLSFFTNLCPVPDTLQFCSCSPLVSFFFVHNCNSLSRFLNRYVPPGETNLRRGKETQCERRDMEKMDSRTPKQISVH